MVIFHNYGLDLETVQKLYEKCKNGCGADGLRPVLGRGILDVICHHHCHARAIPAPVLRSAHRTEREQAKACTKLTRRPALQAAALSQLATRGGQHPVVPPAAAPH